VALLQNRSSDLPPELVAQVQLPEERGSVQTLAPAISTLLQQCELRIEALEFFSVTVGPGSFTGLRVGLATIKVLAMATAKPIAPVSTLHAIALRFAQNHQLHDRTHRDVDRAMPHSPLCLVTAINAFRKQVFSARWTIENGVPVQRSAAEVIDAQTWCNDPWAIRAQDNQAPLAPPLAAPLAHLQPLAPPDEVWVSGSALGVVPVPSSTANIVRSADPQLWQPLAEHVGSLGWQLYRRGQCVTADALLPNYLRQSAAEEKRQQRDLTR